MCQFTELKDEYKEKFDILNYITYHVEDYYETWMVELNKGKHKFLQHHNLDDISYWNRDIAAAIVSEKMDCDSEDLVQDPLCPNELM